MKMTFGLLDYGWRHYFMCTVHSASMTSNGCTLWATGAFYRNNSENKILIRYHIVCFLFVIFSRLFLSTLALMPLSLLVDHSYWKRLQTAENRNATCDLLGSKRVDANHDAFPSISGAFRLLVEKHRWYSIWFKPLLISVATCKFFQ